MLARLTQGQIDVLDRIVLHKTSKEIARELDIAPNTVDQRVKSAWAKLGTTDRASTARKYVELKRLCGQTTYGSSDLDGPFIDQEQAQKGMAVDPTEPRSSGFEARPSFLEALDVRFGRTGRVVMIVLGALLIGLVTLVVMTISATLSNLLR